jgi:hypothetical protein
MFLIFLAAVHSKKKNLIALLLFRGAKSSILNMQGMSPIQESSGELLEVFTVFEKEVLNAISIGIIFTHISGKRRIENQFPSCFLSSTIE